MAVYEKTDKTLEDLAEEAYGSGFSEQEGEVDGPGHFYKVEYDDGDVLRCSGDTAQIGLDGAACVENVYGTICSTDSAGNKTYEHYTSHHALTLDWEGIEEMVSTFFDGSDDDDDHGTVEHWCRTHHAPHAEGGLACELRQAEIALVNGDGPEEQ